MSQEYFDILKELGNIGAGNATTALAQMLQCKVDMSVPKVGLLEFREVGGFHVRNQDKIPVYRDFIEKLRLNEQHPGRYRD